jgi:tetratricopeptide (TPR) repeat protein
MRRIALHLMLVALVAVSRAALAQNEDVQALVRTARELQAKGETDRAARQFEAAARACEDPAERAEVCFELGCMLASDRGEESAARIEPAIAALRKAAESPEPGMRVRALNQLMTFCTSAQRYADAIAAAQDLVRNAGDDKAMAAYARRALARCYEDDQQFDKAAAVLEKLLADEPDLPARSAVVADLANVYFEARDVVAGMKLLEAEAARDPGDISLARRLINLYQQQGKVAEAEAVCERSLRVAPDDATLSLLLYELRKGDGTLDDYVKQLAERSAAGERNATARLAELYFREGRKAEAIEQFERLARMSPDEASGRSSIIVHQRLGWLYRETGDLPKAREQYEAVVKLDPENIGAYSALGDVYAQMGDRAAALEAWRKSARYSPDDADSIERLGRLLYAHQLYAEARDLYLDARQRLRDDALFASDMATVLEAQLDVEAAIKEHLTAVLAESADAGLAARAADRCLDLAQREDKLPFLIEQARQLREEHPAAVHLAQLLLRAYLAHGDTTEAAALLSSIETLGPAIGVVGGEILRLGDELLNAGDAAGAAAVFGRLQRGPTDVLTETEGALGAAEALGAQGDWAGAARSLESFVARRGASAVNIDVLSELAGIYLHHLHQIAKARSLYEAMDRATEDPQVRHDAQAGIADCLFADGRYQEAAKAYAALRLPRLLSLRLPPRPPFGGVIAGDGRLLGGLEPSERGQYMVAECAFREGDFSEAARLFKEFADRRPGSDYTNDALARVQLLEQDIRQDPQGAERYVEALSQADRGEVQAAAEALEALASADPDGALADDALLAAANLLADAGDAARALEQCQALATSQPDSLLRPNALLLSARLLAGPLDQPQKALDAYASIATDYADAPAGRQALIEADDLRRALGQHRAQ